MRTGDRSDTPIPVTEEVLPVDPQIQLLRTVWAMLRTRAAALNRHRHDDAGYTTETVVVTALLVALAIAAVALIAKAVIAKANGLNLG